MVRFDLGSLLQGQTSVAKLKVLWWSDLNLVGAFEDKRGEPDGLCTASFIKFIKVRILNTFI